MADREWFGEIHTLIVRELGEPSSLDGLREITDYEIVHPGCPVESRSVLGSREVFEDVHTCDVGEMLYTDSDLAFSLKYSGAPVTEPGTYRIQGWGRKITHWELGPEYDGGIGVVGDGSA